MKIGLFILIGCFFNTLVLIAITNKVEKSHTLVIHHSWMKRLPATWSFMCSFPVEYRDAGRAGFLYWNEKLNVQAFVEDPNCNADGIKVNFINTKHPSSDRIGEVMKEASRDSQINFYKSWPQPKWQVAVARHEVGHILGLYHSQDKGCLMNSYMVPKNVKETEFYGDLCSYELRLVKQAYGLK